MMLVKFLPSLLLVESDKSLPCQRVFILDCDSSSIDRLRGFNLVLLLVGQTKEDLGIVALGVYSKRCISLLNGILIFMCIQSSFSRLEGGLCCGTCLPSTDTVAWIKRLVGIAS